ncbi:hypothetical protein [Aquiflexum lacus]|uniref:hypothetical protein n=1 Tax=Aquiflexum lacus TaxID=2483805 RepID=UPI001893315D|nr:hypothetical protein [Aquiflexum lacus]
MNTSKIRLKRKTFRKNVQIKVTVNTFIQPFKEMPCETDIESPDHINAHDLFSHYTADIIKKDVIFTR